MEMIPKLSVKSLGFDRGALINATKTIPMDGVARIHLGRVVGEVNDLKQTVNLTDQSIQTGLKGMFYGQSSIAGREDVRSGICYLPSGLQDMIEGSLASAKAQSNSATVKFALDLYAVPDTNPAGYSFLADNIIEAETVDPLKELMDKANATKNFGNKVKTIAAPEDSNEKAK